MKKVCLYCGKEFNAKHSVQRYCSCDCMYRARDKNIIIQCKTCNKRFRTIEALKNVRKFCSRKCLGEFLRQNNPYGFQKGHKSGMTGKPHSEETKRKIGLAQLGSKNHNWKEQKTEKIRYSVGYILYKPNHPFCKKSKYYLGYVHEHRFVVEQYLGRYLEFPEVVHHINRNPLDNRIQNLMAFKNQGSHLAFHRYGHCDLKYIIYDGRFV